MSDERDPRWYGPLRETHQRVAEEAEARRQAEQQDKDNSPEARLAAMEQEIAEKVRAGRMSKSKMAYQLRRFENALVVEMNNEAAQKARDEAASRAGPQRASEEIERDERRGADREAESVEREADGRGR